MSDIVLRVENLSKQYRLGVTGSGTLRDDINRWWAKVRGKEDPTLKIGSSNSLDTVEGDYVWALQDINFEVKRGEVLGIIGKNGAGKSTLLKILSKVTGPTTGQIKAKGRIASLLEVGTGMHPELTGRENIFLNGAILGMTKAEVRKKLDEIIDFAGIAKYVDTPIKRYSSGMSVRLGFAVAAFLEPEILIVDEVLAVGDAEFQKKAIGKMQDVSKGEGRTVLFVSHNMESVLSLCTKCLLLKNGNVLSSGLPKDIIDMYISTSLSEVNEQSIKTRKDRKGNGNIKFTDTWIENDKGKRVKGIKVGDYMKIVASYEVLGDDVNNIQIAYAITSAREIPITDLSNVLTNQTFINVPKKGEIECIIPKIPLNVGSYYYNLMLRNNNLIEDWITCANAFEVLAGDYFNSGKLSDSGRLMFMEQDWKITKK